MKNLTIKDKVDYLYKIIGNAMSIVELKEYLDKKKIPLNHQLKLLYYKNWRYSHKTGEVFHTDINYGIMYINLVYKLVKDIEENDSRRKEE